MYYTSHRILRVSYWTRILSDYILSELRVVLLNMLHSKNLNI